MTAQDHLRLVAHASHETGDRLAAARRAAAAAIGTGKPGHSLLRRLLGDLFGWLGKLVPRLPLGGSVAGLFGYAVLLALAGVLVLVAIRWLRGRSGRSPAPVTAPGAVDAGFAEARAAALRLAPADPLEALRQLYAALLREVGRRRGWRPLPGRSNWTFVRRLGSGSGQAAALAECTRLFEGRVYGSLPAAESDVRRVDELSEAVLS